MLDFGGGMQTSLGSLLNQFTPKPDQLDYYPGIIQPK
jgi:hypothetical protein